MLIYAEIPLIVAMSSHIKVPEIGIPQFFAGRHVFITGGSGFMGKVLINKLLRACPDIGNIYMLMREKRGINIHERVEKFTQNILFDELKETFPNNLKKIIPIEGDVTKLNLGISDFNFNVLINCVSIVYHVAATVRFNDPLTDAVLMNTRGTREVCNLVIKLKNPILVHVSTAYCQHDKSRVEEITYPAHANWEEVIHITEIMDRDTLKVLTPKFMAGFPNTYTFSKSLAESVVIDICGDRVPTIIFRPTIVVSTFKDPISGWCDNFNGPVGITAANAKGVIRSTYVREDKKLDFMPVDIAINGIIISTWLESAKTERSVSVYNGSNNNIVPISQKEFQEIGYAVSRDVPTLCAWSPNYFLTSNPYVHMLHVYLFQLLPAIFFDVILRIFKQKPQLVKLQRKIYAILHSLEYFMFNEWEFLNDRFLELEDLILPQDKYAFSYNIDDIDSQTFFTTAAVMGQRLLFNEKEKDYPFYRKIQNT